MATDADTLHQPDVEAPLPTPETPEPDAKNWLDWFKRKVKQLKQEVQALYHASQDPRTPFLAKVLVILALAYALSPIDLIPDFIPVLGLLDDFVILPALLWIAVRMVPAEVLAEARSRAEAEPLYLSRNWVAAVFVFALWDIGLLAVAWWPLKTFCHAYLHEHVTIVVVGLEVALVVAEAAWLIVTMSRERSSSSINVEGAQQPLLDGSQPAVG